MPGLADRGHEGGYTHVVVADESVEPRAEPRPENSWIADSDDAHVVTRSNDAAVYEITGPLDPDDCPDEFATPVPVPTGQPTPTAPTTSTTTPTPATPPTSTPPVTAPSAPSTPVAPDDR